MYPQIPFLYDFFFFIYLAFEMRHHVTYFFDFKFCSCFFFLPFSTVYLIIANTYVGTKAVATGWGTLKEDGKPSCILQEVEVPIMANSVCVENTNYTQKMITENMLCAGYPGVGKKDSCQVSSHTHTLMSVSVCVCVYYLLLHIHY